MENFYQNPIDVVEDVVHSKKWTFSRADDNELVAEIASHWCVYRLYFSWSEQIKAINFTVTFDIKFPESKSQLAYELLAHINENSFGKSKILTKFFNCLAIDDNLLSIFLTILIKYRLL